MARVTVFARVDGNPAHILGTAEGQDWVETNEALADLFVQLAEYLRSQPVQSEDDLPKPTGRL